MTGIALSHFAWVNCAQVNSAQVNSAQVNCAQVGGLSKYFLSRLMIG